MAKPRQPKTPEMRVLDPASIAILKKAEADGVDTAFSRMDMQSVQCKFGSQGSCCRICYMGPCRITSKTPLGFSSWPSMTRTFAAPSTSSRHAP